MPTISINEQTIYYLACNAFDLRSSLPELSIPVLIICGYEDTLTPIKYANYLQANLPQATTEIIA
ncbi:MAG: alpha/beta hydrolase [Carboxydocellales bacterium]